MQTHSHSRKLGYWESSWDERRIISNYSNFASINSACIIVSEKKHIKGCEVFEIKMAFLSRFSSYGVPIPYFRAFLSPTNHIYLQLGYFLTISLLGFLALKLTTPRIVPDELQNLDLFFTSVSASTVSSMSVLEMEIFSNTQLIVITLLMFLGGEVFSSFLSLQFRILFENSAVNSVSFWRRSVGFKNETMPSFSSKNLPHTDEKLENGGEVSSFESDNLYSRARKYLCFVILGYLLSILTVGSCFILLYTSFVSRARNVLKGKGLNLVTFAVFSTVSTFVNCGFIPTNENMIVFKENSGLLLIIVTMILLGNTLYPPFLRILMWVLRKMTKREEFSFILKNYKEAEFDNLFSNRRSGLLVGTVFGFLCFQLTVFWIMEWNSAVMDGLSSYQKVVSSLFQVANSRHSGESVFDLSLLSPAVWVVFLLMMYLPPYITFIPTKYQENQSINHRGHRNGKNALLDLLSCSDLSYLLLFIVLICITERDKLKEDPINFSVLNITIEVISAYGNVGFTTGYSCKRQIQPEPFCKDKWIGLVGKWSVQGKFLLIVIMLFGRLKKYNVSGGKGWVLT